MLQRIVYVNFPILDPLLDLPDERYLAAWHGMHGVAAAAADLGERCPKGDERVLLATCNKQQCAVWLQCCASMPIAIYFVSCSITAQVGCLNNKALHA